MLLELLLLVHAVLKFPHLRFHAAARTDQWDQEVENEPDKKIEYDSPDQIPYHIHKVRRIGNKKLLRRTPDYCLVRMGIFHTFALAKRLEQKGTKSFPSLFPMIIENQVQAVAQMMEGLLAGDPQYFLVEVRIRPTNNIKVYLDGDKGISIEKCVALNRQLYKMIESSGLFPADDFSLEVSSPGLDEPLRLLRQYHKNVGRKVEVLLRDGVRTDGVLKEVTESGIKVEETRGKNKKKETIEHYFPFETIKSTKIQIVF